MACVKDTDCGVDNTLVCFTDEVSWFADEFGNATTSQCLCATWYGFDDVASGCTGFTGQTYLSIGIDLFVVILGTIGCLFGVWALLRLYQVHRLAEQRFLNPTTSTAILTTAALLSVSLWRANAAYVLFNPEIYTYVLDVEDGEKFAETVLLDRALASVTAMLAVLAALNVSLSWIELANRSSRFRRRVGGESLSWYTKLVYSIQALFSVSIVVLMALNQPFLATIAAFPVLIFIVITYAVGRKRMVGLLEAAASAQVSSSKDGAGENTTDDDVPARAGGGSSSKKNAKSSNGSLTYVQMLELITRTSRRVNIWVLLIISTGLAYAIMSIIGWKNFSRPGQLSWVVIPNDIFCAAILGAMLTIQRYLHTNIRSRTRRLRIVKRAQASTKEKDDFTATHTFTMQADGATSVAAYNATLFNAGAASFHEDLGQDVQEPLESDDEYV